MSKDAAAAMAWLNGGRMFDQVGIVVRDLHATLELFTGTLGIGPWRVYSYGPGLTETRVWGKPATWELMLAFSPWDAQPQIEIIQPVSGVSIHQQFLDEHPDGVQHFAMRPTDFDATYRSLSDKGFVCAMEASGYGVSGDGRIANFDTREVLWGAMLEIVSPPSVRAEPLEEWTVGKGRVR